MYAILYWYSRHFLKRVRTCKAVARNRIHPVQVDVFKTGRPIFIRLRARTSRTFFSDLSRNTDFRHVDARSVPSHDPARVPAPHAVTFIRKPIIALQMQPQFFLSDPAPVSPRIAYVRARTIVVYWKPTTKTRLLPANARAASSSERVPVRTAPDIYRWHSRTHGTYRARAIVDFILKSLAITTVANTTIVYVWHVLCVNQTRRWSIIPSFPPQPYSIAIGIIIRKNRRNVSNVIET